MFDYTVKEVLPGTLISDAVVVAGFNNYVRAIHYATQFDGLVLIFENDDNLVAVIVDGKLINS